MSAGLRLTVQGPAGQTITLRHAEVLENGEFSTRPLRTPKPPTATPCAATGSRPGNRALRFTAFAMPKSKTSPGELTSDDIRAVVCHSDLERTGWFECSDPLINRLHENVVWSMRGNFLDIPTDCPQRDERLGWTADIQSLPLLPPFSTTRSGFLASWLQDLAAEQQDAGGICAGCHPERHQRPPFMAAAWGDAAVIVPWVLYQRFGDLAILAAQFESMRAWVDRVADVAATGGSGSRGFSSAIGSTRPLRPTDRAMPAPTAISSRPPTSPVRPSWSAKRRVCSAWLEDETHYLCPRRRNSSGLCQRVRHAHGTVAQRCPDRLRLGNRVRAAPRARAAPTRR